MLVKNTFRIPPHLISDGDLGLEIEVEGRGLPPHQMVENYWNIEHDGSLRGEAREYVLRKPMSSEGKAEALANLDRAYIENATVVDESVRAGVHVHVNVQNLTMTQVFTYICAYNILEDLLVKFCGEYREGNLFCLRMKDADYLLWLLERVARQEERPQALGDDIVRYASLNVTALRKFGSLEFRSMRGTRDLALINTWADILLDMRNVSTEFENPKELYDWIVENGTEAFAKRFLGDNFELICNHKGWVESLDEGFIRGYQLACATRWQNFKTKTIGGLEFPIGVEFPDVPEDDF